MEFFKKQYNFTLVCNLITLNFLAVFSYWIIELIKSDLNHFVIVVLFFRLRSHHLLQQIYVSTLIPQLSWNQLPWISMRIPLTRYCKKHHNTDSFLLCDFYAF